MAETTKEDKFVPAQEAAGEDKPISAMRLLTHLILEQRFWERVKPENQHVKMEKHLRLKLIDEIISSIRKGMFSFKVVTDDPVLENIEWIKKNTQYGFTIETWGADKAYWMHLFTKKKRGTFSKSGKDLPKLLKEFKEAIEEEKKEKNKTNYTSSQKVKCSGCGTKVWAANYGPDKNLCWKCYQELKDDEEKKTKDKAETTDKTETTGKQTKWDHKICEECGSDFITVLKGEKLCALCRAKKNMANRR